MAKELAIGLVIGAALSGGFKATFNQAQKTVQGLGDRLAKSYQSQSRLSTRIERAQQKQLALQQRISLAYASGDRNVDKLVRRYERMQQAIGRVVTKQQQFTAAIQRAEQAQKTLQSTIDRQQARKEQRQELGASVMKSSATATAIALPVWSAVKTYTEQEESANNLKIAMMKADGTFGEFDEISKIAGDLGNELPGTRKDFYDLARALKNQGISDAALKRGGLATSAKLNVLLDMDQMAGGEFFAKMMEAHKLSEAEMGVAADDLQRAMFAAGMNKEQMYGAMAYYASNVRSMKLTGRENTRKIFAIEGLAAQQGMEGTSFGTGFSTMLDRMNKGPKMLAEAKKGMKAEAAELMDKSGVKFEFWDKKGNFKGIDAMIGELEKLDVIRKKFGDEGAGLVAEGLFGVEGKRLALLLAEKGLPGLQDFLNKMQAQASLEDRIAQKTKTLSSALEALGGVWESAVGTFGSAFADDIKSFANTAQNFIEQTLTPWIEQHKSLIKWGVATAMGLASLSTAVFALRFAFSGLFSVGAALKLPMQLLKAYQAAKAVESLGGSVSRFTRLSKGIGWAFTVFKSGLSGLARGGVSVASVLGGMLVRGATLAGKAVLFLGRAMLANPIGLAVTAIALGAYLIYQYWEPIKAFFGDLWTNIKTFFNSGISNITATILNWSPLGLFYKVFAGVLSWFGIDLPNNFTAFGKNIIDGFVNGITNTWTLAKEKIGELGDGIKSWFAEKLGIYSPSRVFMGYGENTVDGLVIGVAKSAVKAAGAVTGVGEQMQQAMPKTLSAPVVETATKIATAAPKAVTTAPRSITSQAQQLSALAAKQVTASTTPVKTNKAKPIKPKTANQRRVNRQAADKATAALTASYLPVHLRRQLSQTQKIAKSPASRTKTAQAMKPTVLPKPQTEKPAQSMSVTQATKPIVALPAPTVLTQKQAISAADSTSLFGQMWRGLKDIASATVLPKPQAEKPVMSNFAPKQTAKTQYESLQHTMQAQNMHTAPQAHDGIVVNFNPTINVSGTSNQSMAEQVQQGLQMSLREFEQLINRVVDQKMRRAY